MHKTGTLVSSSTAATEGRGIVLNTESPQLHPPDEARRLRGCIHDLTRILALSALWTGPESRDVMRNLLRTIVEHVASRLCIRPRRGWSCGWG